MIISCTQCDKKFEIESNLIPSEGRLLQCSSCNHKWFYKRDILEETKVVLEQQDIKTKKKDTGWCLFFQPSPNLHLT